MDEKKLDFLRSLWQEAKKELDENYHAACCGGNPTYVNRERKARERFETALEQWISSAS